LRAGNDQVSRRGYEAIVSPLLEQGAINERGLAPIPNFVPPSPIAIVSTGRRLNSVSARCRTAADPRSLRGLRRQRASAALDEIE